MKKTIKKLLALTIVTTTVLGFNSIGANAEWKRDNVGWWNTEGSSYSIGWRQIDSKWYYFNTNGYMETGWISDTNGKYYYLNADGSMASNTVTPDGYTVDASGVWDSTISKVDLNANTQPTTSIQPVPTNNIVVNSDTTSTSSISSSSSSATSGNGSSSSSSKSKYYPESDKSYATVFYDSNYNITRASFGKYNDIVSKYGYETQYACVVRTSDFQETGVKLLSTFLHNYNIKNDNGEVTLVKKTVNEDSTPITEEPVVTEPVDPVVTSPSAVSYTG